MERNADLAQGTYDRNKEKLERVNKVLVHAKAGIEHLAEKLQDVKLDNQSSNIQISDNTLVEALSQCENKLKLIYESVSKDSLFEEAMKKM